MELIEAELLTDGGNNAIVRLPHRAFPGVLVQGDTLAALRAQLVAAAGALRRSPGDATALDELGSVIGDLDEILDRYEEALSEHGLRRPY
ncbi:DUF6959 family protein [Catellatospora sichuanensis]|uniref:DUF6959 family protein n=1 Tax=Catellatospora sichuanensis TaxID=1969805 RepID=UPI00118362D3|nr:hypothetical protein [Catellatospora sichuanensis]